MKEKKSVAFFITGLDSGGLENYLLRFLQYKASSFEKIIVFCKGGKSGQLEQQYLLIPNLSIHIRQIGFFNLWDYLYLYRFIKKNGVNIVCDFTGNFSGLVLFVARLANIEKRVAFYRGSTNHFNESKIKLLYNNFVQWLTCQCATSILSNSKAAFNFFFSNLWKENNLFDVIYNGINIDIFLEEKGNLRSELNIPKTAFVIGHTGRYNEAKNHASIIKVALKLCKEYEDIYFLLCGNRVKDNLKELVKEQPHIILLDNRMDIPKVLNTLDCYYFPSLTEGQPNALLEAMLVGLPFVASNIEPIKETVPKEVYTQLISALDIEEAIEKLIEIKNNKELRQLLNLQDWVIDNYNPKVLFQQFYDKL